MLEIQISVYMWKKETETEAAEPQGAPEAEEAVRCIFCGGKMSRSEEICPHCGKKR